MRNSCSQSDQNTLVELGLELQSMVIGTSYLGINYMQGQFMNEIGLAAYY